MAFRQARQKISYKGQVKGAAKRPMNMQYFMSVDRAEGAYAVCVGDDGKTYNLPLALLPQGAGIGDTLVLCGDVLSAAKEETARRKAEIAALQDRLFK